MKLADTHLYQGLWILWKGLWCTSILVQAVNFLAERGSHIDRYHYHVLQENQRRVQGKIIFWSKYFELRDSATLPEMMKSARVRTYSETSRTRFPAKILPSIPLLSFFVYILNVIVEDGIVDTHAEDFNLSTNIPTNFQPYRERRSRPTRFCLSWKITFLDVVRYDSRLLMYQYRS